jgi:hypothetical protein
LAKIALKAALAGRAFLAIPLALALSFSLAAPGPLWGAEEFSLPGPVRRDLIALAKEPLTAAVAGREVRVPRPNKALDPAFPMVVSLYLNGLLAARAWNLESPGPMSQTALALGAQVLVDPSLGRVLEAEELPLATVGVAIIRDLAEARDDRDLRPGMAAIVFSGLTVSVGLPSDAPPPKTAQDLLNLTCELAGLRPTAWLGGQSTILTGLTAETLEK